MRRGGNPKDVIKGLEDVLKALKQVSATRPNTLDEKLADYAFFPLSHVLRQLEKHPVRAKELTLECILVLLRTAWRNEIAPPLGIQFLILLSFLADQKEIAAKGLQTSEELQALTLYCLEAVFKPLSESLEGRKALLSTANVPHLAKSISVVLDNALEGSSAEIQLAAVSALGACCRAITDREALGTSFLPGIMSCLTKVLTPSTSAKRSYHVLSGSLDVLTQLLPYVLGDEHTRNLPESSKAVAKSEMTKSWLKATGPQIKIALANIMKLRQHNRPLVRRALARLCVILIQECRESLSHSIPMLLETLVTMAGTDDKVEAEVKAMMTVDADLTENLRSSLHSWTISLPRVMLQADETAKHRVIQQVSVAFKLLNERGVELSLVDNVLAMNLRDTVANAIQAPSGVVPVPDNLDSNMELTASSKETPTFEPVMALRRAQEETVEDISKFMDQISSSDSSLKLAEDLLPSVRNTSGDIQLASFWVSLNMVRKARNNPVFLDDFLNLSIGQTNLKEDLLEQLYSFSISTLSEPSDVESDWRLQALSLEAVALQAAQQKRDFRDDLIDALYPVVHLVGSPNSQLRNHAITCLNLLAESCGYSSSGEMIVQNVDYLVNAVALRLNTFDISPQAPQVLLMMVKLSGPSLLPYLDDLVESMFAALESFHGYPKLVELLFSVLKAIAQEGTRAPQLTITDGAEQLAHKKSSCPPRSIEAVLEAVKDMQKRRAQLLDEEMVDTGSSPKSFPRRLWKEEEKGKASSKSGEVDKNIERNDEDREMIQSGEDQAQDEPPLPKTYALLLNISKLTQHYLTIASPELRVSLLSLLDTTFPVLAKHENSLLPLIHTLWPVLIPRLEDHEAYVVSSALEVIGMMCVHAGDFMKGRIEEVWPIIQKVYKRRTGRAGGQTDKTSRAASKSSTTAIVAFENRQFSKPDDGHYYVEAPARIIWNGLVELLIRITTYVTVTDGIFDDILEILLPVIESREDVRHALDARNPDAVWLAIFRSKAQRQGRVQAVEQVTTTRLEPQSEPTYKEWRFAELV
jgi:TELO2-interacting protein 1